MFSPDQLDWDHDGADWPHREASRFVMADRIRFHVQVSGSGPVCLLLHGTGASTHSWRDVVPALRQHFTVVVPDLPGHGFTTMPAVGRISLASYAQMLGALLDKIGTPPSMVVGHSAGAAIGAEMIMQGHVQTQGLVSFNGAFVPMGGMGDRFFSPLARLLSVNPLMPRLFAWRAASHRVVSGLIEGTGSHLDETGIALYRKLMMSPSHCRAALQMMAHWNLEDMPARIGSLSCPLLLVRGDADKAIPEADTRLILGNAPQARLEVMRGAGHLAHEEKPDAAVDLVLAAWQDWQPVHDEAGRPREMAGC